MKKTRRDELESSGAVLHRKRSLLERDPLFWELKSLQVGARDRRERICALLRRKYEVVLSQAEDGVAWTVTGAPKVLYSRLQVGGPIRSEEETLAGSGSTLLTGRLGRPLRLDPIENCLPPVLKVMVRLDLIRMHDLDRLAAEFKRELRTAKRFLESRPSSVAPTRFSSTMPPAVFERDLRRYDLNQALGLSFRQIALIERGGRLRAQRPVSFAPGGESSVRESVGRIYAAIHRRPYTARRRRLDSAPADSVPYSPCPQHGGACGPGCQHFDRWWAQVEPTLPAIRSGS